MAQIIKLSPQPKAFENFELAASKGNPTAIYYLAGHYDFGLPDLRVGTVDKFQGQEAPIAIYSTATSSQEDAPRGMEFLYNLNRLNVATSRAKCACVLVTSPELMEAQCRTPRQMQLANAFCRYKELAQVL